MTAKGMLRSITPPVLWEIGREIKRRALSGNQYAYAPAGWATPLPTGSASEDYWAAQIDQGRAACAPRIAHQGAGHWRVADHHVDNIHVVFGYVLALATRNQRAATILDYGGGLGDYYWVGRTLMPDLALDYHCKELPPVADAGRKLSPAVTWHTDDTCLLQQYDVVMFCSSLQYVREWKDTLRRGAAAARGYVFLADLPTVHSVASCVATEGSAQLMNLHWLLNRDEVVDTVEEAGCRLVQDFAMGAYPRVANAPEQPTTAGWLFQRH